MATVSTTEWNQFINNARGFIRDVRALARTVPGLVNTPIGLQLTGEFEEARTLAREVRIGGRANATQERIDEALQALADAFERIEVEVSRLQVVPEDEDIKPEKVKIEKVEKPKKDDEQDEIMADIARFIRLPRRTTAGRARRILRRRLVRRVQPPKRRERPFDDPIEAEQRLRAKRRRVEAGLAIGLDLGLPRVRLEGGEAIDVDDPIAVGRPVAFPMGVDPFPRQAEDVIMADLSAEEAAVRRESIIGASNERLLRARLAERERLAAEEQVRTDLQRVAAEAEAQRRIDERRATQQRLQEAVQRRGAEEGLATARRRTAEQQREIAQRRIVEERRAVVAEQQRETARLRRLEVERQRARAARELKTQREARRAEVLAGDRVPELFIDVLQPTPVAVVPELFVDVPQPTSTAVVRDPTGGLDAAAIAEERLKREGRRAERLRRRREITALVQPPIETTARLREEIRIPVSRAPVVVPERQRAARVAAPEAVRQAAQIAIMADPVGELTQLERPLPFTDVSLRRDVTVARRRGGVDRRRPLNTPFRPKGSTGMGQVVRLANGKRQFKWIKGKGPKRRRVGGRRVTRPRRRRRRVARGRISKRKRVWTRRNLKSARRIMSRRLTSRRPSVRAAALRDMRMTNKNKTATFAKWRKNPGASDHPGVDMPRRKRRRRRQ